MTFARERSTAVLSPHTAVPIVFAHLMALSLGAALAWAAAPELARKEGSVASSPAFAVVAAFAAFVWLPAVGYFVSFHGDWSYLYLVAPHPSAIDLALALLSAGCVVLGFLAAAGPARKRRLGPALAAVGVPVAAVLMALPFVARRLMVSATYAQFHGNFGTEPVGSSLLGKGVVVLGTLVAIAVAWTAHALGNLSPPPR
jgi:hypothetical protein